jgi:hypothetical protein
MADVFSGLTGLIGALSDWATAFAAILNERFGELAPVVAGAAAACAVAIITAIYFRGGHGSSRDVLHHGVAIIAVLGLLTFAASDMRRAALAYLGITPSKPAAEFEIQLPKATALADASETQPEIRMA